MLYDGRFFPLPFFDDRSRVGIWQRVRGRPRERSFFLFPPISTLPNTRVERTISPHTHHLLHAWSSTADIVLHIITIIVTNHTFCFSWKRFLSVLIFILYGFDRVVSAFECTLTHATPYHGIILFIIIYCCIVYRLECLILLC